MAFLVYDKNNNLSLGGVTKTKNGVVIKSCYSSGIKNYCLKWDDVEFVKEEKEMPCDKTRIFFTPPDHLTKETKQQFLELFSRNPDSSIYSYEHNLVIGKNIKLNLSVCLFHGLVNVVVPISVDKELGVYQKKLFKKICVVI